jgi:protein phosphatase PTC7
VLQRPQVLKNPAYLTSLESASISADQSLKNYHLLTAYSGFSKDQYITNQSRDNSKLLNNSHLKGKIGDDAWFISKQKGVDVLGVADGVGGWHEVGYDPSKFSFNLMRTCKRIVEQEFNSLDSETNNQKINNKTPIYLLEQSYQTLLESKNNSLLIGSSTACIIVFNQDTSMLHTANLGDSGFIVIRDNKIIHRSQEQKHYFNSPYQIAILPLNNNSNNNSILNNISNNNNNNNNNINNNNNTNNNNSNLINDSPNSASVNSIELNEGDLIVLATDGLWDNLSESQLLLEISNIKNTSQLDDLEKAAYNLAHKAFELAFDPDYQSPFSIAAKKSGININGGKPDGKFIYLFIYLFDFYIFFILI